MLLPVFLIKRLTLSSLQAHFWDWNKSQQKEKNMGYLNKVYSLKCDVDHVCIV